MPSEETVSVIKQNALVSVIIPAYGETVFLERLLNSLAGQKDTEVIISVPFGDTESKRTADGFNVKIVEGKPGRGEQLHSGAQKASGKIFLFCHADTILPEGWKKAVMNIMEKPGVSGGAFRLAIDSELPGLRVVAFFANARATMLGLIYGDQAIFTSRSIYEKSGGIRPLPVMEDIDFILRLRRIGKVSVTKKTLLTSPRRWLDEGIAYCSIRNSVLISLYLLGVPPAKLARYFKTAPRTPNKAI